MSEKIYLQNVVDSVFKKIFRDHITIWKENLKNIFEDIIVGYEKN